MLGLPKKIVVFDLEYTTWKGAREHNWSDPKKHKEVVQIGAVIIDKDLSEIDSFEVLVKPRINPVLSDYFVDLTKITQAEVDKKGVDFSQALKDFYQWSNSYPLFSFGDDGPVLIKNAQLYDIEPLFKTSKFFDVRDVFKKFGIPADKYTSGTIVEAFGKKNTLSQHSAINDARTIIEGLKLL